MSLFLYPLFGWLADARYGRYKVIKCSLHILWLASVSHCLTLVMLQLKSADHNSVARLVAGVVFYTLSGLALGGTLTNIFPFGIDQLPDGSSTELASLVRWMILSWILGSMTQGVVRETLARDDPTKNSLVAAAVLSVAVCLDQLCSQWLVKEALLSNAIPNIFKVTKFAVQNKYPRLRSAFSYWNRGCWSRMDLAKSEYGGPFTADKVEDVKAFWRMMLLACVGTFSASMVILLDGDRDKAKYSFKEIPDIPLSLVKNAGHIVTGSLILLIEALPCSRVRHYINSISLLRRVACGMVLLFTSAFGYGSLHGASYILGHVGVNDTCFYDLSNYNSQNAYPLDYQWEIIPIVVNMLGIFLALTSAGEFICAQSPYSMRGLLIAMLFGLFGIFTAVSYALLLGVRTAVRGSPIRTGIGCGALYYCCVLLMLVILTAIFGCCYKLYKPRQRSHLQSNEIVSVGHYTD